MEDVEKLSLRELVELGASDAALFYKAFFPKTFRQESAPFARLIDDDLDGPARYIAYELFRDAAKTTRLRAYAARRIAYAISRTILYIGKSEDHALRSVEWIKKQVEFNHAYSKAFQLSPGDKWRGTEIEVRHGIDEVPIRVLGLGITGSLRGTNIDDYRPDLIICDDVISEDNTKTLTSIQALEELLMGAVKDSLAPESEAPHAKLILLNTPITMNDPIERREKDSSFLFRRIGIITPSGESAWPARYPLAGLLEAKNHAIASDQLEVWLREKECKIVSSATAPLQEGNLRYYDIPPDGMIIALAIDPVPPPSMEAIAKGLKDKDSEVVAVVGITRLGVFVLEYALNRGHEPEWLLSTVFTMIFKYNPLVIAYDAVNYQRTIGPILEKEMRRRGRYVALFPIDDKRSKQYKITQVLGGVAKSRSLYIRPDMLEFKEQYIRFPDRGCHDDIIDAVNMGIMALQNQSGFIEGEFERIQTPEDRQVERLLENYGDAP